MKKLANDARKEARSIKPIPINAASKKTYAKEVEDLNAKIRVAEMNSPRERVAQAIANARANERKKANPGWGKEERKREEQRALIEARAEVGAGKEPIEITDREWEAIQANAITTNKLKKILLYANQDALKQRATPKFTDVGFTDAELALIMSMARSGRYTQQEIASRLGPNVSVSSVSAVIRESA